jgi:hypothetical protein
MSFKQRCKHAISTQSFVFGRGWERRCKKGFKAVQEVLDKQKPEAAYFLAMGGMRTGLLIINMDDASQIPEFSEPWFLAFNAEVWWTPVMVPADLAKAGPVIADAAKNYG